MPRSLTAAPAASAHTLTASARSPQAGMFPGATTYPGASRYPGRGTTLGAAAATHKTLTETNA